MAARGHLNVQTNVEHQLEQQQHNRLQVPARAPSLSPSRRSSVMSGSLQLSVPSRRESVSMNLLLQQHQQHPQQHPQQQQHHHQQDQRRLSVASWMLLPQSRVSFSGLPLPPAQGDWHQDPPCENSYRLGPASAAAFSAAKVRRVVEELLGGHLRHVSYQQARNAATARALTEAIRERVKGLGFDRHKLVCCVAMADAAGQGLGVAGRCLWAEGTDGAASATFVSAHVVAVASVYGLYHE
ncbi:dynein light chain Tctex-type 4 [Lethenteron reissneri]|uniref:dynein light chain Tctex-type 4 n=1 Tax=Lethenteron reissneri TaxID=7753 RepID=UPI002AB6D564|nr:dynein light chain Tctex-type 4 [Lethenteron reissneri]XP_061419715.1 dynein light chain Tctex-type 4 [Lethenteron reissneri]XP_061419724.1 dynein light chain Tctex-type 4 [Lethenteron reissneri]